MRKEEFCMSVQRETYHEAQQLIRMLEAVINEHKPYVERVVVHWDSVYKTAEFHRVTNMAYYALLGTETKIPPASREKFEKRFRQAVTNEEVLENVVDAVCWKFEQCQRHILPAASYACRKYYKRKEMSECQEAELLVEKDCRGLLQELMFQMNFEFQKKTNDAVIYVRNGIRLIFKEEWGDSIKRVEKHFKKKPGQFALKEGFRYVHEMTAEELYLRQICDLAESFIRGCPRMRMFVNLWLFYLGYAEKFDYRMISRSLRKLRLEEFAVRMLNLSALWFGRRQMEEDDFTGQELGLYVMSCGREGIRAVEELLPYKREEEEREIVMQSGREEGKNWRFPSREYMQVLYPVLEHFPILLPILWIARIFRLLRYRLKDRIGKKMSGDENNA